MALPSFSSRSSVEPLQGLPPHTTGRPPVDITAVRLDRALSETIRKILTLPRWEKEWGGGEIVSSATIQHALTWILKLYAVSEQGKARWHAPNVYGSPDGEAVFEWWHHKCNLTLYIKEHAVIYLKAWGPDIHAEMDDGEVTSLDMLEKLWLWLHS